MEVDNILEHLKEICIKHPLLFRDNEVGKSLATAFVHQILSRFRQRNCDDDENNIAPSLHLSYREFTDLMAEEFLFPIPVTPTSCLPTMNAEDKRGVLVLINALWESLANKDCPIDCMPINKLRFLTNMLQSHFPNSTTISPEENEFLRSKTKALDRHVGKLWLLD